MQQSFFPSLRDHEKAVLNGKCITTRLKKLLIKNVFWETQGCDERVSADWAFGTCRHLAPPSCCFARLFTSKTSSIPGVCRCCFTKSNEIANIYILDSLSFVLYTKATT
jgi:hypothetical protein